MRSIIALFALLLAGCDNGATPTGSDVTARETAGQKIRIVGSSTVAPFATSVSEQFGSKTIFSTPIVETTGTGGGMKLFCEGDGPDTPSIADASRPMTPSEWRRCAENGVTDIIELPIGFDGIVLVQSSMGKTMVGLTKADIFLALAHKIPGPDGFIQNPHTKWSDVREGLPELPIRVIGPPGTSGTRDAFVSLAMEKGASLLPPMRKLKDTDPATFKAMIGQIRTDGLWVDGGENDTAVIQQLVRSPSTIGVVGFSFYDQNRERVRALPIAGVAPTRDNIASGDYLVSRQLYLYVKTSHLDTVDGLEELLEEWTSEESWGAGGYLEARGLVPLPADARTEGRARISNRRTMAALTE